MTRTVVCIWNDRDKVKTATYQDTVSSCVEDVESQRSVNERKRRDWCACSYSASRIPLKCRFELAEIGSWISVRASYAVSVEVGSAKTHLLNIRLVGG